MMSQVRQMDFNSPKHDGLSQAAKDVLELDAGKVYIDLVVTGDGNPAARPLLAGLTPANVLDGPVVNDDAAAAVLCGSWLWQDWIHESHDISQSIESPTGSLWHAVMHRREGDFNNAKYWYGRSRNHPALATMAREGVKLINASPAAGDDARTIIRGGWDPYALTDFVESVYDSPDHHPPVALARELQRLEFQILFDFTVRLARGESWH
jgi:hypothetical protein